MKIVNQKRARMTTLISNKIDFKLKKYYKRQIRTLNTNKRFNTEKIIIIINMNTMDMSLSKLRELAIDREAWHATAHGVAKSRTRLND